MLTETQIAIPNTSWFMLRNGANQLVRPFDLLIYTLGQPAAQGQPTPLVQTNNIYQLVPGDRATLNNIHDTRLNNAIAALPDNNNIQDDPAQFLAHSGINVPEAIMNVNGLSQPVVRTGGNAAVKTLGARPCLPLLVRAVAGNGTPGVGCVHLSANDMASLTTVRNAVTNICTMLRNQLGAPAAPCRCYLVGGNIDPDFGDVRSEYARTVATLQALAAVPANNIVFAGALVPATVQENYYIDVVITPTDIFYQVDTLNSGSEEGGSEGGGSEAEEGSGDDDDNV